MYFFILILLGSLVAMNLFLVVIATQFGAIKQQEMAVMKAEHDAEHAHLIGQAPTLSLRQKMHYCWTCITDSKMVAERQLEEQQAAIITELVRIEAERKARIEADSDDDDELKDEEQIAADDLAREVAESGPLKVFVLSSNFENFILGVIVLNTLVMTTEAYGQTGAIKEVQYWLTMLCNVVFFAEMLIKLVALGIRRYAQEGMNLFDAALVMITIFEIASGGGGGITALRTLRLVRLVKLMRRFKQLQLQVKVLVESLSAISSFCVLLGLYMFVYAILGMYLFGAQFCTGGVDCWASRSNFNTFYRSFITVFQLLTIEDWPGVMFDAVKYTHYVAVCYFITLLGSGTYILCNLFIAILLDSFAERAAEEEARALALLRKRQDRSPEAVAKLQNFRAAFSGKNSRYMFDFWKKVTLESKANNDAAELTRVESVLDELALLPPSPSLAALQSPTMDNLQENPLHALDEIIAGGAVSSCNNSRSLLNDKGIVAGVTDKKESDNQNAVLILQAVRAELVSGELGLRVVIWRTNQNQNSFMCMHKRPHAVCKVCNPDAAKNLEETEGMVEYSLLCLFLDNPIRQVCIKIARSKPFDHFILLLIGLNSCTMAVERRGIGDTERFVVDVLNYMFNGFFLLEMITKLIAMGLYGKKAAYLSDGWNRLDGFLVTLSLVDVTFVIAGVNGGSLLSILKILRILRALRPLRVINKAPKLKRIVGCMVEATKSISSTLMIVGFVFLIFAIFGVNLLGGKLYHCMSTDSSCDGYKCLMPNGNYVETKADCESLASSGAKVLWINKTYNWDNVGEAIMTLFFVVSLDGWVGLMFEAVDAVGPGKQPVQDYNEGMCMFFVSFLVVGNFFVLNLFVGVIVDSFNNSAAGIMSGGGDISKEEAALKKEEQEEVEQQKIDDVTYYAVLEGFRLKMYKIATDVRFDLFITGVIIFNVLVMAMEFYEQPYLYGLVRACIHSLLLQLRRLAADSGDLEQHFLIHFLWRIRNQNNCVLSCTVCAAASQ